MASNSSGELAPGASYAIGQYSFSIDSFYDESDDSTRITAECTYGEEAGEKSTTVNHEMEIVSWHVEISDDAADVYASVRRLGDYIQLKEPVYLEPLRVGALWSSQTAPDMFVTEVNGDIWVFRQPMNSSATNIVFLCDTEGYIKARRINKDKPEKKYPEEVDVLTKYTYQGRTAYIYTRSTTDKELSWSISANQSPLSAREAAVIAFTNADPEAEPEDVFVARFKIIPEDADPEDWDDPIDDGDPAYTLHVTVRGALSGRHNDPILLRPHSYVPAANPALTDYGCGGDGGYGGGGGAGASTVIVYKYSTSKAGSHETYAYARRHGYGSGGGKGARGGDGCIIIYW